MTQTADKGLNHAMQKAADTRVFTNAINAKKNKHKLGNPRVFIKKCDPCLAIVSCPFLPKTMSRLCLQVSSNM